MNIIRKWPMHPYSSALLNTLWQLIPGLILWSLWKETNKRIFKSQSTPLETIWNNFNNNIQESLALHSWQEEDFPKQPKEIAIWESWQFKIPPTPNPNSQNTPDIPQHWSPPQSRIVKLNFDGVSRGNPGQEGFGGIFRDSKGDTLAIYYGSIGWDTNNSAKLEGLLQGLCLIQLYNFSPSIIEGDSLILINMVNQIL